MIFFWQNLDNYDNFDSKIFRSTFITNWSQKIFQMLKICCKILKICKYCKILKIVYQTLNKYANFQKLFPIGNLCQIWIFLPNVKNYAPFQFFLANFKNVGNFPKCYKILKILLNVTSLINFFRKMLKNMPIWFKM